MISQTLKKYKYKIRKVFGKYDENLNTKNQNNYEQVGMYMYNFYRQSYSDLIFLNLNQYLKYLSAVITCMKMHILYFGKKMKTKSSLITKLYIILNSKDDIKVAVIFLCVLKIENQLVFMIVVS